MKHTKDVFKPTGMWESTREKEYAAFSAGASYGEHHWKTNHNKLLKKFRQVKAENERLRKALEGGGINEEMRVDTC